MKLLDRLEKRLGRFAIPNLALLLIVGQVAVFLVLASGAGNALARNIAFVPQLVLEGQVWRIFTFLISPPTTNVLFAFFFWYLFYLMSTALENTWGAFRFNLFLLIGFIASVAAAFLRPLAPADNYFLYGTVFLAFARLYPDFIINAFLVLPIKIKWLALLAWVAYALQFISGDGSERLMIIAALANYFLFFWRDHYRDLKDTQRRKSFQAKLAPKSKSGGMLHECRICGLNSEDEPKTAFRYCSKCAGQACYCPQHLHDHQHVAE